MGTPYPVARTARRISLKLQTHDVRTYLLEDILRRTQNAVTRSGGTLLGGPYAPRKSIQRWCVNRSPHVHKKSREHFWMVTHRRVIRWDAAPNVDRDAHLHICDALPASVAARVTEERPGLMCLGEFWDTLQAAENSGDGGKKESSGEEE